MLKIRPSTGRAQHALLVYILFYVIKKVISSFGRDNKDNCMRNKLLHIVLEAIFAPFFVFKHTVHFHKIELINGSYYNLKYFNNLEPNNKILSICNQN